VRKPQAAFALGRLPVGAMNKTEAAYANHLANLQHAGEVLWWKFEAVKLRLADNTFYSPDFAVMLADGLLEMHEVKGHWQDDARAKIKIAAAMFPFRFIAVKVRAKRDGGGWAVEDFGHIEATSVFS
jgi:hypothetical protein